MDALTFVEKGKVKRSEAPMPEPKENEKLIQVLQAAVCGSDLSVIRNGGGMRKIPVGFISGHEFVGVEQDTGKKVVVNPVTHCGSCMYCRQGKHHLCKNRSVIGGSALPGAFAEFIAVPNDRIFPVEDMSVSNEKLAVVEPLAVGVHAANLVKLAGGPVAVIGAGTIGLCTLHALVHMGAKDITVADLSPARLEVAKRMGATQTVSALEFEEYEAVFDAAGLTATRTSAVEHTMSGGTVVAIALAQNEFLFTNRQLVDCERTVKGSFGYTDDEFRTALAWTADIDTSWIFSVPFEEAEEKLNLMLQGKGDPNIIKLEFKIK